MQLLLGKYGSNALYIFSNWDYLYLALSVGHGYVINLIWNNEMQLTSISNLNGAVKLKLK